MVVNLEEFITRIPLAFSKVSLPPEKDVEGRKKVLSRYNERVVLLLNEHTGNNLHMGRVKTNPEDGKYYHLQKFKVDGSFVEISGWYNGISELYGGVGTGILIKFKQAV